MKGGFGRSRGIDMGISRQLSPCSCGSVDCPICGAAAQLSALSEVCNDCGAQLVHIGGDGVIALLCPVCDADSALLDPDDPAVESAQTAVEESYAAARQSLVIDRIVVEVRRRINAGESCGICTRCMAGIGCVFLPNLGRGSDFIVLPPSRREILLDKLRSLFARWQDDAYFLALLFIGLMLAVIFGKD